MRRATALPGLIAAAMLAAGCAGSAAPGGRAGATGGSDEGSLPPSGLIASLNPDVHYPESFDQRTALRAILGATDLAVGRHRLSFVLTHELGLVRFPVVGVATYRRPEGPDGTAEGPVESGRAFFSAFPAGTRGTYVTQLTFDRAGPWELEVSFPNPDGGTTSIRLPFEVSERPSAPAVGDPAPASANRTLADVDGAEELTTGSEPDPGLYRTTIAAAIAGGRPFVVVFASPAFCTSVFCGPQVEVASALLRRYGDRVDFIHVDIFANPREVVGNLARGARSPLLAEWGVTSDEWTFVVDRDGRIAARFESFVAEEELERAVLAVLGDAGGARHAPGGEGRKAGTS